MFTCLPGGALLAAVICCIIIMLKASPVDIHDILLGEHHVHSARYRGVVCVCVCVCVCIRACLRERHREMVCQLIGKEIETQQDQPVYYTHVVNEVKWNISTNWTGC